MKSLRLFNIGANTLPQLNGFQNNPKHPRPMLFDLFVKVQSAKNRSFDMPFGAPYGEGFAVLLA